MSTPQSSLRPSITFCDLSCGGTRIQLYPSPAKLIGSSEIVTQLEGAYRALEDFLEKELPYSDSDLAELSSTVSIIKVDDLPVEPSNCHDDCSEKGSHLRFHSRVTQDSGGNRTYSVDACSNPQLSLYRHATYEYTGVLPFLLHFRREIDTRIIGRFASIHPTSKVHKISLEEDEAGLSWVVQGILDEPFPESDSVRLSSSVPDLLESADVGERKKNLTSAAAIAWSITVATTPAEEVSPGRVSLLARAAEVLWPSRVRAKGDTDMV